MTSSSFLVLFGVFVATLIVKALLRYIRKEDEKKKKEKAALANTDKTADEKTLQAKALEAIKKVTSTTIFWYCVGGIALLIVFYLLWSFFAPVAGIPSAGKLNLMPYLLAPLMGLMSYFLSNRGSKRLPFAIGVTVATAFVITLWIHPEMMKAVVNPFWSTSIVEHAKETSTSRFAGYLAITLFILAVLSGKLIEAVIGIGLMIIFWNWNCF